MIFFLLITASRAFSQNKLPENYSLSQRLKVREDLQRQAKALVMEELKGLPSSKKSEPIVRVVVGFDDTKLVADYATFVQTYAASGPTENADIEKQLKPILDTLKKNLEDSKETTKTSSTEKVSTPGIRFGMLNVDLQEGTQISQNSSITQVNSKPMLGLTVTLPSTSGGQSKQIPIFPFSPADYIKSIGVTVLVPAEVPPPRIENIRKTLVEGLELKRFNPNAAQALIEFGNLEKSTDPEVEFQSEMSKELQGVKKMIADIFKEKEKQESKTWGEKFVDPTNQSLGGLLAGLSVAATIIIAGIFFFAGMGKVAKSMKELKPASASDSSKKGDDSGGGDAAIAEAKILTQGGHEGISSQASSRFGPELSAQALTQEMKNIRESFVTLASKDKFTFAELIADMFYQDSGMEELKHFVSFVGFISISPVLDALPRASIDKLESFLEEQRNEPPNLLMGVEATQKLLTNYNTRSAQIQALGPLINESLRKNLLLTEDKAISKWLKEAPPSAEVLAVLLRISTADRAQMFMTYTQTEQLREAFAHIGADAKQLATKAKDIDSILEKLSQEKTIESGKKLRLIKSLLLKTTPDDEDKFINLVREEPAEIRLEVMRTKYLFSDLKFLPGPTLKSLFDTLNMNEKSTFLYICPLDLREMIFKLYPADSGILAQIKEELESIEKNAKRKETIEQSKRKILEDFMKKVRTQIQSSDVLLAKCVTAFCEQEGVAVPEVVETLQAA